MGKGSFLSSPSLSCFLAFAHACTQIQKRPDVECMVFSLPPLLTAASLSLFLGKKWTVFHGHSSPVSNEEAEGHWLTGERLWYWYMSFILSFLFPLTLSCSLAFLVLFPWSASVTLILSYPSTSRALKLPRIFLFDMSDSTSETPENVQVFTSFSIPMAMCLSEDLMENTPLQTRKIYLTLAKICPEK